MTISELTGAGRTDEFRPPFGTRERLIQVRWDQLPLVYRCLGGIRKSTGTQFWTVALELACLDYLSGPSASQDVIVVPADGETRPFRFCPHEDQEEIIDLALEIAKETIGTGDDGAALVHICMTFGGLDFRPALLAGMFGTKGPRAHEQGQDNCPSPTHVRRTPLTGYRGRTGTPGAADAHHRSTPFRTAWTCG